MFSSYSVSVLSTDTLGHLHKKLTKSFFRGLGRPACPHHALSHIGLHRESTDSLIPGFS